LDKKKPLLRQTPSLYAQLGERPPVCATGGGDCCRRSVSDDHRRSGGGLAGRSARLCAGVSCRATAERGWRGSSGRGRVDRGPNRLHMPDHPRDHGTYKAPLCSWPGRRALYAELLTDERADAVCARSGWLMHADRPGHMRRWPQLRTGRHHTLAGCPQHLAENKRTPRAVRRATACFRSGSANCSQLSALLCSPCLAVLVLVLVLTVLCVLVCVCVLAQHNAHSEPHTARFDRAVP
jgi:hypothetical protein